MFLTQIKGIPTPSDMNVQLSSVVKMEDDEALNFKKKIMRYVHLRLNNGKIASTDKKF